MTKIINQYYQLNINSFCETEIYVNDVIVDEWKGIQTKGRERNTSLAPINHILLESGKYKVLGKMYPRYGEKFLTEENSYLGIEFLLASIKDLKNTRVSFHPKIESPWDGLSQNIKFPYFEIYTVIEVELPLVLDRW